MEDILVEGIPADIVAGRNLVEGRRTVVVVRRSICKVISERRREELSKCALSEEMVALLLIRPTLVEAAEARRRSILERPL